MPCFVGNRLTGYDLDSEQELIDQMIKDGVLIADQKNGGYILADKENNKADTIK